MSDDNSNANSVCPESTIESANRRNFMKAAAVTTAAVGLGATLLGETLLPKSSAKTAECTFGSPIFVIAGCNSSCCCFADYAIAGYNKCTSSHAKGLAVQIGCYDSCNGAYPCCSRFENDTATAPKWTQGPVGVFALSKCGGTAVAGGSIGGVGVHGNSFCGAKCGVRGSTKSGYGVKGLACTGIGVYGTSNSGCGVYGTSIKERGVFGHSCCSIGVYGHAVKNGCGVFGQSDGGFGVKGCSTSSCGVYGKSVSGTGITGTTGSGTYGVVGKSLCPSGPHLGVAGYGGPGSGSGGVVGYACCGGSNVTFGVIGTSNSTTGYGVYGCASATSGKTVGLFGQSRSPCGISVLAHAFSPSTLPLVARGDCGQSANLMEFQKSCGQSVSVVNKNGAFGIGTATPSRELCVSGRGHFSCGLGLGTQTINTTLAVNGSVAAKARTAANNCQGKMTASDFALFANGASKIVLPAANTQSGMMVFVKNAACSAICVAPAGCDTIEGSYKAASPVKLGKKNDSLTLISNGAKPGEWYVLSGVKCASVFS